MIKTIIAAVVAASALSAGAVSADSNITIGAGAGTTGVGMDASWRFHDNFGVTAGYYGGLSYDGDYDTEEVNYTGDIDLQAGALKLSYYPFGGSFFLSAGAMMPDMTANVTGRARNNMSYEYGGVEYTVADVGSVNGELTIADGVQPYLGLGWRSSHESGLGFYSEFGVMSTDVEVSLSSSRNFEGMSAEFADAVAQEEKRLEEEAEDLKLYPVAQIGITYTF